MDRRTLLIVLAIAKSCATAHSVLAGIVTPVSSDREVSVLNRDTTPQTPASFAGPLLGPWQATAYVPNLNFGDPNVDPNNSLVVITSTQQSDFADSGISYSGFVFIDYSTLVVPDAGCTTTNRCDATFHVDGDCPYQFQCAFSAGGGFDFFDETSGRVSLQDLATSQAIFSFTGSGGHPGSFGQSGMLPTGDYTLSILIQRNSGGTDPFHLSDGRTQVDATFFVPTPSTGAALCLAALGASRRRRLD